MRKGQKARIIYFLILGFFVLLCGIVIDRYVIPFEKQVVVSKRIEACEAKGGRYGLIYFSDRYYESCKTIERRIDRF